MSLPEDFKIFLQYTTVVIKKAQVCISFYFDKMHLMLILH